jgi:hypothetical protein
MPRVRLASGGWQTLAVDSPQPAHLVNERGERIDLDLMLKRLHLMSTDFDGAPSHKKELPTHCKYGHPMTDDNISRNGSGGRLCKTCQRASAIASRRRRVA